MSLTESVVIHWIFACIVSMGFLLSFELGRVSLPKLGLCVEQMEEQVDTGLVTSRRTPWMSPRGSLILNQDHE